jgi:hypothetical protein
VEAEKSRRELLGDGRAADDLLLLQDEDLLARRER